MRRRDFLKQSLLASGAILAPQFLRGMSVQKAKNEGRAVIIIQLSGGNDGLNTVVPFRNDLYYKARPKLGIAASEILKLNDELGFNPAMKGMKQLYDQGLLSIINSVGYPNPDRSHFRSMDIWQTASSSDQYWQTGWLGRYLDSDAPNCENPIHALDMKEELNLALKGQQRNGFATGNLGRLKNQLRSPFLQAVLKQEHDAEHQVAYLYKTMISASESADYLYEKSKIYTSKKDYPQNAFGRDLKQAAELRIADCDSKIYYVSLDGFDTHANQRGKQDRLLKNLSEGLQSLVEDLKTNKKLDDTLVMVFSEFGRRVAQNASGGTDHGTANNLFLISGSLKKAGIYNEAADLSLLDAGDLKYKLDFRQVYASVLEKWLGVDSESILKEKFPLLTCL